MVGLFIGALIGYHIKSDNSNSSSRELPSSKRDPDSLELGDYKLLKNGDAPEENWSNMHKKIRRRKRGHWKTL